MPIDKIFRDITFQENDQTVSELLGLDDKSKRDELWSLTLLSPAILFLIVFVIVPVVWIAYLSFHTVSLLEISGTFVGFSNYVEIISSPETRNALWVGTVFAVGSVVFQLIIGLFLALTLNRQFRGSGVVRTFAILPYIAPTIGVVLMWKWLLNPIYGLVNKIGVSWGLFADPINFFGNPDLAMPALIVGTSWKFISFVILILLARLQSIDDSLYEQAKISGASQYQMFRTVTLPNLWNAILLVILLRLIWMYNKFGVVWLFTGGGPLSRTTNIPVLIYETTFQSFNLGKGSATAMLLFVILAIVSIFYFWYFEPSKEVETTR